MSLDMKKSIIYLFPIGSIISITLALLFPILRYEVSPSQFYPFWFWGFPYLPLFEINILDIPHKIISLIIVSLIVLLTSSIFLLRKYPNRLKIISNIWFWAGIGIIILIFLWILSWNIVVPFFAPYGFIFEFVIILPFVSGLLLIFGRIYFVRICAERTKE